MTIEARLERMEAMQIAMHELLRQLHVERCESKAWYSIEEFARLVGREPFTCREWCRQRRIQASKKRSGRGAHASWAIAHEELERYRREGLLSGR